MSEIETSRLRLIALTREELAGLLDDPARVGAALGLPLAPDLVTPPVRRAIGMKLAKMDRTNRSDHAWLTYWLLVAEDGAGIGLAGFKGLPDARGQVEIGYGLVPACEGRGYMTEAVRALIAWAFDNPGCLAIIAPNTLRSNPGSNRVLEKAGMTVYEETAETLSWRLSRRHDRVSG